MRAELGENDDIGLGTELRTREMFDGKWVICTCLVIFDKQNAGHKI